MRSDPPAQLTGDARFLIVYTFLDEARIEEVEAFTQPVRAYT